MWILIDTQGFVVGYNEKDKIKKPTCPWIYEGKCVPKMLDEIIYCEPWVHLLNETTQSDGSKSIPPVDFLILNSGMHLHNLETYQTMIKNLFLWLEKNYFKANDPMELSQYHGYGGLEWYYDLGRSRMSASGGHRFDTKEGYINRVWSHAEGDFVQRLFGTVTAHINTQFQRIQIEQQPFFTSGSTVFGVEKAGLGSASMEWGVDTQNRSAGVRQQF